MGKIKLVKYLLAIFLILLFRCSSVNDSDVQEQYISFSTTIKDSVETFKIVDNNFQYGHGATYFSPYDVTNIRLTDLNLNKLISFRLSFPGQSIGEYEWITNTNIPLIEIRKGEQIHSIIPQIGLINITKYGNIGERVEGSFDGVGFEDSSMDTINVTGEFSLQRLKDF